MEVACSRIWGLKPTTQTHAGGTPHKPALPATQPRAPAITPDPKSSTHHTEQWVQWKKKKRTLGKAPSPLNSEGRERKYYKAHERHDTERWARHNHEDMRRHTPNIQRSHWRPELPRRRPGKAPHGFNTRPLYKRCRNSSPPEILVNPNANTMPRYATTRQTNCTTCSWSLTKLSCIWPHLNFLFFGLSIQNFSSSLTTV